MPIRLVPAYFSPFLFAALTLLGQFTIFAGQASADPAPFHASLTEQFASASCPAGVPTGTLCAAATGSGTASHLGAVKEKGLGLIFLAQPSPTAVCSTAVADASITALTAANGDQIAILTKGTFCLTGPSGATDSGAYQIVGGTGRFARATGTGSYLTIATFGSGSLSGTSVSKLDGTLDLRSKER